MESTSPLLLLLLLCGAPLSVARPQPPLPTPPPPMGSYVLVRNAHPGSWRNVDIRRVYVHSGAATGEPRPLVVGLAGDCANGLTVCGLDTEDGGGEEFSARGVGVYTFDLLRNARALGFSAACPDMIGSNATSDSCAAPGVLTPGGTWNAAACCSPAADLNYPDVGFIRSTIEHVKSTTLISRTYAVGLSGGAQIGWRLACEAHDIVDGIAVVGGAWFGTPAFVGTATTPPGGDWKGIVPEKCGGAHADSGGCWRMGSTFPCSPPKNGIKILFVTGTADPWEPHDTCVASFQHYATEVLGCSGWVRAPSLELFGHANASGNTDGPRTCGPAGCMDKAGPHPTTCFTYEMCSTGSRPAVCSVKGMSHHVPSVPQFDVMRASMNWFGEA